MANQEQSRNGIPQKDADRPSPDLQKAPGHVAGGEASARGTGDSLDVGQVQQPGQAGEERGMPLTDESPSAQDYRGDGPGKLGVTSDNQPDLVEPSGVNARNHQERGDAPVAGDTLNFDDGTDEIHPRGKVTGAGRTWDEKNPSDAGRLGAPNAGMSDHNGPSDPDAKRDR
jgi:hypothetical protein